MHLLIRFVCFLIPLVGFIRTDDYLDEVQGKCYTANKTYACVKYKFFKYIDNYSLKNLNLISDSSVRFVDIPDANVSDIALFTESREYARQDSEFDKIFKFLQRQVDKFLHKQGLSLDLPEEVTVVEEERKVDGRGKKKKMIILPILILLKLCKVKMLVTLVLAGVMFIKKILLLGAFILPGVVAAIKSHCKSQQFHVVPYHVDEDHYTHDHDDDSTGYGVTGYGSSDKHHFWDRKYKKKYPYL